MFKKIPNAIQLQASAVAWKRCRRFWANLVPDFRFSSLAWVSGLLALLVVAVSPASAQNTDPVSFVLPEELRIVEGASMSYFVRLSDPEEGPVLVAVSITNDDFNTIVLIEDGEEVQSIFVGH